MQTETDILSTTFAALADPTRRAILARLAKGQATVTELAAPFDLSLPAISKHLRVLQRARLIEQGRQAQWRPCRLDPSALKPVDAWLDSYRQFWAAKLDRLETYLGKMHQEAPPAATPVAAPPRRRGRPRRRTH